MEIAATYLRTNRWETCRPRVKVRLQPVGMAFAIFNFDSPKLRKMVRYPITAMGTACVSVYRTFVLATGAHPQASGQQAGARRQPWACGAGTPEKTPCPCCRSSRSFFPTNCSRKLLISDSCRAICPVYTIQSRPERRWRLKNGCKLGRLWRLRGGLWRDSKARSGGAASSGRLRESAASPAGRCGRRKLDEPIAEQFGIPG
jgi:hypothetical protein